MVDYADFAPLSCFSGTLNKFVCVRCDGVFCSPVALSLHVEKRHGLLFRVKCGNCGMGFPGQTPELAAHIRVCCDTRGTAILGNSVSGPNPCKHSYHGDRNGSVPEVYDVEGGIKEEPEEESLKSDEHREAKSKSTRKRPFFESVQPGGHSNSIPLPTSMDAAAEAVNTLGSGKRKKREDDGDIPTARPAKFGRLPSSREDEVSGDRKGGADEENQQLGSASLSSLTGVESQPDRPTMPLSQCKKHRKLLWRPDGKSCGICREGQPGTQLTPKHFREKHKLHCPVCLERFESRLALHCHFKRDHSAWAKVAVGKDFNDFTSGLWFTNYPTCRFCQNSIFYSWGDLQTHGSAVHHNKFGETSEPNMSLLTQCKETRKLLWRLDRKSCGVCPEDQPGTQLTPKHFLEKHKLHCPVCLDRFESRLALRGHFKRDHFAWAKVAVGKDFNDFTSGLWFTNHPMCCFCQNSEIFYSWGDLQKHGSTEHRNKFQEPSQLDTASLSQCKEPRKLLWRLDKKSCGICPKDEPGTQLTPKHFREKHKLHCPVCLERFESRLTLHCHFKRDHSAWAKVAVGKDFNDFTSGLWFTNYPMCRFCQNSGQIFYSWDDLQNHDCIEHRNKVRKANHQLALKRWLSSSHRARGGRRNSRGTGGGH